MLEGFAERQGALEIRRGARETEAALVGQVARFAAGVRAAASASAPPAPARAAPPPAAAPAALGELLARPLRIVVPSRSLREHVAAVLVGRLGGALCGVALHTLRGLACEALRRAGRETPGGELLFPVLVRRLAAREAPLRAALEELHDGYGAVAETVSDLLDAGLDAERAARVESLVAASLAGALADRARALLRVAVGTAAALAEAGLEHRSTLFRRATEALESNPALLAASAILVHGFADATGVQAELLATLVRRCGARVIVDLPDDPGLPGAPDPGCVFADRLLAHLRAAGARETGDSVRAADGGPRAARAEPPELSYFRAPGAQAEAREVAERIARLLAAGAEPESIGVVARDLTEHAVAIRTHFARLGVPFSGAPGAAGLDGPQGHAGRALLALLREGELAPCDRWLDAAAWLGPLRRRDLRLALHALGLARLREAAAFDPSAMLGEDAFFALPVRRGIERVSEDEEEEDAEEGGGPRERERAPRRTLDRSVLEEAAARARRLLSRLRDWPAEDRLDAHLARVRALAREDLGWRAAPRGRPRGGPDPRDEGQGAWLARLRDLETELGGGLRLDRRELGLLLERATQEVGGLPLGGAGGGVAVLDAIAARGRTFAHLFVVGANRGRFPRPLPADPLLPDGVRETLLEVLPHLPVKGRGFDEDRYLFAKLLSASPRVTLSWQEVSDDGKERAPSPLAARVRLARGEREAPPLVPAVLDPRRPLEAPAHELAVRAALAGERDAHRAALALAFEEARAELGEPGTALSPERLAAARIAAIDELHPSGEGRCSLGPYAGLLGSAGLRGELAVTRLEAIARCPWQAFLERVLRLEPLPDARVALPALDPRTIGNVLHRVLERIAVGAGAASGVALEAAKPPVEVAWPDPDDLEEILREEARRAVHEEGLALPGLARVLAARARPYLEAVRRIDWPERRRERVLGAELRGAAALVDASGRPRRVRFRADRADLEDGALVLTDYKAGQPVYGTVKGAEGRRAKLLAMAKRGEWLQAAAYASADAPGGAEGRYLFARPDPAEGPAALAAARGDAELRACFERAARALLRLADAGAFLPRLVDEGQVPRRCRDWCAVAEACAQHDTDARHRLDEWAAQARRAAGLAEAEAAARDVWWLGREEER